MDAKNLKRVDIERVRNDAQNCASAGVTWMTITERPEALAELAKLALDASNAAKAPQRDVAQLADWLLTDPQSGAKLRFAGPLESDFLGLSRVRMENERGDAWTLTAGLREGYLTAAERMANIRAAAADESADAEQAPQVPVELQGVENELKNCDGFWRSCSGCHETEDGHAVGHYPFSNVLKCEVGGGCSECGGIGAVWDNTDYEDMADWLARRERDTEKTVAAIMEQAQVFASAWSLVGGVFDSGNALETAEQEKAALLEMLKAAAPVAPAAAAPQDLLPNAMWTRHGSGSTEWWSFKGYEARKDSADQWVLRKAGEELYRHTYLQVVMAHAERAILEAAPAPAVAAPSLTTDAGAVPNAANAALKRAMDLLDAKLGDTDPNIEGLTQDEVETTYPVLAAMQILTDLYMSVAPEHMSCAARDVLAERARQVNVEGWTPAHDDQHGDGQLALVAGSYALACAYPHERDLGRGRIPPYWPWDNSWWKPTTPRRNLIKAGALILAEIERIDRAGGEA